MATSAAERLYESSPRALQVPARRLYVAIMKGRYKRNGRPHRPGETTKARARRQREGFFEAFCTGRGLDIGHGGDPIFENCEAWDIEDGDAHHLEGLPDGAFDFVYSSHTLEHLEDPAVALRRWSRVIKPGGFLILYLPERDLYEKRARLPSRFNPDHKHFFLLDRDDPPDTIGLLPFLRRVLPELRLIEAKICSAGHTIRDPDQHSNGEYSVEVVLRKPAT